jgi:hypothetical protein
VSPYEQQQTASAIEIAPVEAYVRPIGVSSGFIHLKLAIST